MHSESWLLLVINLPGRNQALRMRIWRRLRAAGAASLRDGVYLIPESAAGRQAFDLHAAEVQAAGGTADVLAFQGPSAAQRARHVALFDRTAEYVKIKARIESLQRRLGKLDANSATRELATLRRDIDALAGIDFFPGKARAQIGDSLAQAEARFNARFVTDEPVAVTAKITRRPAKAYANRTWATRQHLWVDRVCSAWLIRRFIDPRAKFLWLKSAGSCPKRAIGFDFDGAEFSHVGERVTFEVLASSFGLDGDVALRRLGDMVRYLDVGGIPVAEAAGFAAILAGCRAMKLDDDRLLETILPVLDSLYAGLPG